MNEPNQSFQEKLLEKLDEQTDAMNRLTSAVEALVVAMADEDDEDAMPATYMDGTPR